MQVEERRDSADEKRILSAMIVDASVLGRLSPHWQPNLFRSKWSNLIGGWCVRYFKKHEKAPGKLIESLFERWEAQGKDESAAKLIESFLTSLSDDYESKGEAPAEYIVDLASAYFNRVKMVRHAEQIIADIEAGDDAKAMARYTNPGKIELGVGAGIDVLRDKEAIKAAFADEAEQLVEYPDALKEFFQDALIRDGFIAFVGTEKRGKSFAIQDLAWRAMEQGRRVAYFQIGDLSQNQMMKRFMVRAAKRPAKRTTPSRPVRYPKTLDLLPKRKYAECSFIERHFKNDLDWKQAWKACKKVIGESTETLLQLSCHTMNSVSITGIEAILESWERKGFNCDICVIDYADLLLPHTQGEPYYQINETWKQMRALSQARHILVVTATQANAAALTAETLGPQHFSGNKLKMAHVTGMVGLSQVPKEKLMQVQRWNWLVLRESDFNTTLPVHVAGCLAIANPAVRSIFV